MRAKQTNVTQKIKDLWRDYCELFGENDMQDLCDKGSYIIITILTSALNHLVLLHSVFQ